jgi:zinc transport system substrate-binding protein
MITRYHIARTAFAVNQSALRNPRNIPAWLGGMLLIVAACFALGCNHEVSDTQPSDVKRRYVVTIAPVASLITELVRGRAEVTCLLRPGISEHAFELRPSDMRDAQGALALITVAPDIDSWADRIPVKTRIQLLRFVPEENHIEGVHSESDHDHDAHHDHSHDGVDGHVWTDPRLMRSVLPDLVSELCRIDPEGAEIYRANETKLAAELAALDAEIATMLAPVRGEVVFTYHAGLQYFLARYDLKFGGVIEMMPGREPSPAYLSSLVQKIKSAGARALFTEPSLPRQPAEILAREAGLPLFELDPIGGTPGRETYRALLIYNAQTLATALATRD